MVLESGGVIFSVPENIIFSKIREWVKNLESLPKSPEKFKNSLKK
jgi:hypothetical protein